MSTMRPRDARKIREGIRLGRRIAQLMDTEGPLGATTQALYGHPALRDPLTEQAKYRTLTRALSRRRT